VDVDRELIFEDLTPPAGGLGRLQSSLDQMASKGVQGVSFRRTVFQVSAATAIAVGLVAFGIGLMPISSGESEMLRSARDNPAAIRLGLTAEPTEPVSVRPRDSRRFAVLRVDVADPRIVFYRVADLEGGSNPE